MAFEKNNRYAVKLVNDELKLEAFNQFCQHLAKGKSRKSWRFRHPDVCITWQTLDTYMKNEPHVFNAIQMEEAISDGYAKWEQVVEDSADGHNKEANTASLQMLMRNKFGWDKEDKKESTTQPLVVKLVNDIRNE